MKFKEVKTNKKQYLDLLLLADEQEEMINRYLAQGKMYVLKENENILGECVITFEDNIIEIKNLAVAPNFQKHGYGKEIINFVINKYRHRYSIIQVGTGDSPLTIPFYKKCGFKYSYRVKNFFLQNYDHPIYEAGIQLKDMIYLQKKI